MGEGDVGHSAVNTGAFRVGMSLSIAPYPGILDWTIDYDIETLDVAMTVSPYGWLP